MTTIKIAHLYYDLLNLYGEQGNIIALVNAFKNQNIDVLVDKLSINDQINFKDYDLFYLGMGSNDNLLIVLDDIKKYTKELKKAIKDNKYIISTGNSHELFGKFIEIKKQKYEGLNIFEYYAKENPQRIVGESIMDYPDLEPIIGFQNRSCVIQNESNHLFTVTKGSADNFKSNFEGYHENNFIGTYLIGPLLIRNPHLTNMIVKDLLLSKGLKFHEDTSSNEYKAYNEYIKNFYEKS